MKSENGGMIRTRGAYQQQKFRKEMMKMNNIFRSSKREEEKDLQSQIEICRIPVRTYI